MFNVVNNAHDFLHKIVIPQHKDFIKNNASVRHALLSFIVINHLYEWVHRKERFNIEHFLSRYGTDKEKEEMAEMLDLARKIANGTKHFTQKIKTRKQGGFSSAFSDGFARPLNVETEEGSQISRSYGKEISVDILLRRMVEFWIIQEKSGFPYRQGASI